MRLRNLNDPVLNVLTTKDVGASILATTQDGTILSHAVLKFIDDRTVSRVRQHAKYYRSVACTGAGMERLTL